MIVTFSGNDGSGKTTLAKKVKEIFLNQKRDVVLIDEFDYFFLGLFKKIMGNKRIENIQQSLQNKNKKTFFKRMIPYIIWIEAIAEYFYLKIFRRNCLILKDRCVYDSLMTLQEQGLSNRFINFLYDHFPTDGPSFFIFSDPSITYERRKNPDSRLSKGTGFHVSKTEMYQNFFNNKNVIRIENNTSIDYAASDIAYYIDLRKKFLKIKTIAISGIDGSGKSTTIKHLIKLLDKLNIKNKSIHFYYSYIIYNVLNKIKKEDITAEISHKKSIENEIKTVKKGKNKLWPWLVIGDSFIQYWFAKLFFSRRLIIFDRFFHDYLVSFDFINVSYNEPFLLNIFPDVDKYFLQIADHGILYERKPEHTPDFFKKCYDSYKKLARRKDLIILDSTFNDEEKIIKILVDNI